jgi:hypothetical protein
MAGLPFRLETKDGAPAEPSGAEHGCSSLAPRRHDRWDTGRCAWWAREMTKPTNRPCWSLRTTPDWRLAQRSDVS